VDTKYVDKRPTARFEVGFGLVDVDRRDEAGELQSCLEAEYITSTIEHLIQTGQSSVPDRDLEALELQVPPDNVGVQHLLIEHAAPAHPTLRVPRKNSCAIWDLKRARLKAISAA
jgi:hypothetical protein